MLKSFTVLTICFVTLCGCVDTGKPVVAITAAFDDNAFAPYNQRGTAVVMGHGSMNRGAKEIRCGQAYLLPATPYTDNIVKIWRQGAVSVDWTHLPGKNASAATRRAPCDALGQFRFENLPAGKWYIDTTVITSPIFTGDQYSKDTWGGMLVKLIETTDGKTLSIILTEEDIVDRSGVENKP